MPALRFTVVYQPLTHGHPFTLFDVDTDPACATGVVERYPDLARELWKSLEAWIRAEPGGEAACTPAGPKTALRTAACSRVTEHDF